MRSKKSGKYGKVYVHMWQTYGGSWYIRASFFVQLLTRICKLVALPIAVSRVIAGLSKGDFEQAKMTVLVYICFSLALGLLTPLTKLLALKGENPIYAVVITRYMNKLLAADIDYFNNNLSGYLTTAARQYSDSLLVMLRSVREKYMGLLLSIMFPVVIIFWVDAILGAVVLILSILLAAYLLWASKIITPYRTKAREYYKNTSGYIADAVSNILAVKASSHEHAASSKVGKLMDKESSMFTKRYTVQAKMVLFRELITVTTLGVLFWLTVARTSAGAIDIGEAVLVTTYALTILTAVYELSDALDEHDDYVDKILPAFEILNRTNAISDPEEPVNVGRLKGTITFKNMSFNYTEKDGSVSVFKNLNLEIPAGQKVGVVGLSGAGKSTLAKLLLRFNEVSEGAILVDGTDIRLMRQADLRRNIAYVPQEPLLFHTTIEQNIALANERATKNQILDAVKVAHADTFITQLPQKFESVVGERGVKLSGGQKQRIVIARAVLQDAPIIVLDEATSALDSESEQIIKDSFSQILKNRTALVVAHRLSTLSEMDRILVIDKGRIVEDGSHDQLQKSNGLYSRLWKRQQMHLDEPS